MSRCSDSCRPSAHWDTAIHREQSQPPLLLNERAIRNYELEEVVFYGDPIIKVFEVRMPCLLLILFAAFPRIALVLLFFFSNYLQRAYHGLILPILGFIFLPLTTLVYA